MRQNLSATRATCTRSLGFVRGFNVFCGRLGHSNFYGSRQPPAQRLSLRLVLVADVTNGTIFDPKCDIVFIPDLFVVAVPHFSTTLSISKTREGILEKLTMTLTAALLVLGTMAMSASAQTQAPGAASLHAQIQKATPVVKQAACRGRGPHCAPGWTWTCGPFGCACRPCF
jgi:hypothetical protein